MAAEISRGLAALTAEQLVRQAAEMSALARRAKTPEARAMLERLAARYRELAARRAAAACLPHDDPARTALGCMIESLTNKIASVAIEEPNNRAGMPVENRPPSRATDVN
jgi:hypothetical protein